MLYSFSELKDSNSPSKITSDEMDGSSKTNLRSAYLSVSNEDRSATSCDKEPLNQKCGHFSSQTLNFDTREAGTSTEECTQDKSLRAGGTAVCKCCPVEDNSVILENFMFRKDSVSSQKEPKMDLKSKFFSKRVIYIKKLNRTEPKSAKNEAWLMSPEGQALKVKSILVTKELPECKGTGLSSTIKFLHEIKEILIKDGVPEEDWVILAASRLKGDLRRVWYEENACLDPNWEQFSKFILKKLEDIREYRREETRKIKRRCMYTNEVPFKSKR